MKKKTGSREIGSPDESGAEKKPCRKRLICLFSGMLFVLLAGLFLKEYFKKDSPPDDRFRELETIEAGREGTPVPAGTPGTAGTGKKRKKQEGRKKSREEQNPDWIGWLKIKGTTISYPVMQRKGDSEYYLHRDFDGNYSFQGTPFLDIRCDTESDNCIIYGHNINGGRMFGALHKYAGRDYYLEHPEMEVRFGEEKQGYRIVSVIRTTTASGIYSFTDTGNWEEYRDYVKEILNGSLYPTKAGEEIKKQMEKDSLEEFFRKYRFVSLSTCRTWAGKDARLLVIGAVERKEMRGENGHEQIDGRRR